MKRIACALCVFAGAAAVGAPTTLTRLGPTMRTAYGVSADGRYVVGDDGWQAVMWSRDGGFVVIGIPDFEDFTQSAAATAVSNDGVVVGYAMDNEGNGEYRPWKWTADGGFEELDPETRAAARGISADGRVIVGDRINAFLSVVAFRWTEDAGFEDLASSLSLAFGVSADGEAIGGALGPFAFRYTDDTGMLLMQDIPGGIGAHGGNAISHDGTTVAGFARTGALTFQAVKWDSQGNPTPLGHLPGSNRSSAFAVSGDGNLVGGNSITTEDNAFIWTPGECGGMKDLRALLSSRYGIDMTNTKLRIVYAISQDGRVLVGQAMGPGFNIDAFVLEFGDCAPDYNNDGQVDFFDYLDFVQAYAENSCDADFNGDGQVDFFDYLDFVEAYSEGC